MPQSVLYLPREDGGQGLSHLSSRGVTFRFQLLQRFLCGPADLVWRPLACTILNQFGGLGLNKSLFLMDLTQPNVKDLPVFYRGLFKVWNLLQKTRLGHNRANIVTLGHVVQLAGADLNIAAPLTCRLGVNSTRTVSLLLSQWRRALTEGELTLLKLYCDGSLKPDENDAFPSMNISPDFKNCTGRLLKSGGSSEFPLRDANRKLMYNVFVRLLNKDKLNEKSDTTWRARLGLSDGAGPEWRALYKPPLVKRAADLQ